MTLREYAQSSGYSSGYVRRIARKHEIALRKTLSVNTVAALDDALATHRERGLEIALIETAVDIETEYANQR